VLRPDKFPLAAAGWPYLLGAAFLAAVATALEVWWLAVPLWLLTAFIAYFFRDPPRSSTAPENRVLSPADGTVVAVEEVDEPDLPEGRAQLVSVFMDLFSVHVNRAPVGGRVVAIRYQPGGFVNAARPQARLENERMSVIIERPDGVRVKVVQVAGLIARRIHCDLVPGDTVQRGARYGMIKFGSRLDVYLPLQARVLVGRGRRVRAGVSEIAEL